MSASIQECLGSWIILVFSGWILMTIQRQSIHWKCPRLVILMVKILMVEMALCTCVAQSRGHGQVAGAGVSWSLRSLPVHWPRLVTGAWV